uniref:Uncharacterized protein n=1 Tax=Picea sitchensis TaxID=3332 RepID=A9P0V5_PICSI|nr:unknown [Picea sitchensis]
MEATTEVKVIEATTELIKEAKTCIKSVRSEDIHSDPCCHSCCNDPEYEDGVNLAIHMYRD